MFHFTRTGLISPWLYLLGILFCQVCIGEDSAHISPLGESDTRYLEHQRASIDELTRRHFGNPVRGSKTEDLKSLQRLLDERIVNPQNERTLQAMGVVLGDLLAQDLDMGWIVYEDKVGRSRALQGKDPNITLFPVTMISRRVSVGIQVDVQKLYDRTVANTQ